MDPATLTAIVSILSGATASLLGGVGSHVLIASTKKIVERFKKRQDRLSKDFNKALPKAIGNIEKQYGKNARVLKFLNDIGQNEGRPEARELFSAATNAYLFKNLWSRNHLPELLARFSQNCGLTVTGYGWRQADEDFAKFFRQLETELVQITDWRELLSYQRLQEIALASFKISGDTGKIVKHLETLVRGLVPPPEEIHVLRDAYLNHLKNQLMNSIFGGLHRYRTLSSCL